MRFAVGLCLLLAIGLWLPLVIEERACEGGEPALEAVKPGPLSDYVKKADKSFQWKKRRGGKLGEGTYAELTLTSQTWKDIVWKHQLYIYRPSEVAIKSQALLWIHGGEWHDDLEKPAAAEDMPAAIAQMLAKVGEQLKCPVAILLQVPQQPMFGGMVEDEIISHTFVKFFQTGDSEWPLLLPMVKSAVRGMDTVQEFAKQEWGIGIRNFTVTGASKRGWTTWLTSAVDPRVSALAPMVIDMLNMAPQMRHQVESFGEFSEQLHDYTEKGLQKFLSSDPGRKLVEIVDPFSYREQIGQPKLIILGTNDRYWPLDALNLYWDGLTGDKYILYVPNNGHGLRDTGRMIGTIGALNEHVANGKKLPQLRWSHSSRGASALLRIESNVKPREVNIWLAESGTRDFRKAMFRSVPATQDGEAYFHELPLPKAGFAAFFGEVVFGDDAKYYLSTNVRIVDSKSGSK